MKTNTYYSRILLTFILMAIVCLVAAMGTAQAGERQLISTFNGNTWQLLTEDRQKPKVFALVVTSDDANESRLPLLTVNGKPLQAERVLTENGKKTWIFRTDTIDYKKAKIFLYEYASRDALEKKSDGKLLLVLNDTVIDFLLEHIAKQ